MIAKQIGMAEIPKRDLGERTFRFACDIVQFCRKLSAQPGVVRNIACKCSKAAPSTDMDESCSPDRLAILRLVL
jgi:hypothetical protein